jgi:hypothetical protein
LFHQNGDVEPLTSADVVGPSYQALREYQAGILAEYVPYTPLTAQNLKKLGDLKPTTLAIMHGSCFTGDCARALDDLNVAFREIFGPQNQRLFSVWHPSLTSRQKDDQNTFLHEVVYEGDAGQQSRAGTKAHLRGVTGAGSWLRRDIGSCSCRRCHSRRIALVSHDTYEIRNGAHGRSARARIFRSHRGDRQSYRDFEVGDEVYGMNDWFADGGTAEFCITLPRNIAQKPATLSHEAAASMAIGALTSWQGLIDRAKLAPGERVLVHGGAGAVGLYAVQLAHKRGARVITTVSTQDIDFAKRLGAEKVIDYKASRFETGKWMSSSIRSAARRSSGHGVSSRQVDA